MLYVAPKTLYTFKIETSVHKQRSQRRGTRTRKRKRKQGEIDEMRKDEGEQMGREEEKGELESR